VTVSASDDAPLADGQAQPAAAPEGPRPFGKYELVELIGTGGMAEIYKARSLGPDGFAKLLVVKKILPEYAQNKAFINMLIAEAKVTSLLEHPNIVQIFELGEIAGQYYIAMELVDGADLLDVLARCTRDKLRVPTEIALFIVSEVCKGLAHAHAATDAAGRALNIIHRDVSPSNILLGLNGAVKIMDFGVATADLAAAPDGTFDPTTSTFKGKLGYLSPEQVLGHPIDRRSDVFALGIILFEALTLKRLFVGKTDIQTIVNIREANVERKFKRHSYIPKGIRAILQRALARDPTRRYQTATDLQEAILDYLFESRLRVTGRSLAAFLRQVLHPAPPLGPSPPLATDAPPPRELETDSDAPVEEEVLPALPADAHARRQLPRDLRRVDLSRASFHFRVDGEPAFGPLDFPRMSTLVATRCVSPREWVSVNGSDWLRTGEVQAIVDLHPALFEEEPDRPLFDGPMNRHRTPRLLNRIWSGGLSGKLKLTRATVQKEIYFDRGAPVLVHSNLKSELLGAFLIERGLVAPEDVDRALMVATEPRALLGTALVRSGLLPVDRVATALAEQFRDRLVEPFSWATGWYEFFAGVMPPRPPIPLGATPPELLMYGIRTHYDLGCLRRIFDAYLDKPLVVPADLAARVTPLGLLESEQAAARALRADTTLSQLLAGPSGAGEGRLSLLRVAFACFQTDHLAFRLPRPG
jgi:serine/threonine protein kinase